MVKLRSDFGGRPFGDPKEFDEFLVSSTLEAFGDVGTNGNSCPLNLIAQAKIL